MFPVPDPTVPNVQVTQMSLVCEGAPNPLVLDLQGESLCGLAYETEVEITYLFMSKKDVSNMDAL